MKAPLTLSIVGTIAFTSCQTGPPLKTASGRPEVFIADVSPQRVRGVIIDRGMAGDWTLEKDTENSITFVKRSDSVMASMLLGSTYDPNVVDRLRFTTIGLGGGTKVYVTEELVSNHGSAFERVTPLRNNKNWNNLQAVLEKFKQELSTKRVAIPSKVPPTPTSAVSETPPEGTAQPTPMATP